MERREPPPTGGEEDLVGGDFYDVISLGDDALVVIGDVVGKGPEAATITSAARHWIRAAAEMSGSAQEALFQLNRELTRGPGLQIRTVCCAILRESADGAEVEIACAGHPPPLVSSGVVKRVGLPGSMLGVWDETRCAGDQADDTAVVAVSRAVIPASPAAVESSSRFDR